MSPRKRIHDDEAARMRAAREKFRAEGKRQVGVWLPGETVEKLDRIASKRGTHRGEIINTLIQGAEE